MRAALYEAPKTIRFVERPIPEPGPEGAVVKIELCGICGTDMHIYFDGILPPGFVPGHENVGTIHSLGDRVKGFKVGDRVVAGPPGSCGGCFYCLHGLPSLCVNGFPSTNGLGRDGGMAEYMLVEDAQQMLYPVPANVSSGDAVLVDTIATAFHGILRSAFVPGDNVVVAGAGPIGLACVQLLKICGAGHVTALEVVEKKRALASRHGADAVFDPVAEGDALAGRIIEMYGGVGADVIFECTGKPQSFNACLGLARSAGQILNLGVAGDPVQVVTALLVQRELDIKCSLAYTGEEAKKCLAFLESGRFNTEGMISDIILLAGLVISGFDRLARDKTLMKVAVKP